MSAEVQKINRHRAYWIAKAESQLAELLFLSIDGDKEAHERLTDDLQTTLIIIWRFDRKLANAD